ncbi:MAG: pseudaminic acid synthase [Methanoregula sp.]|nr:MAG: pseudaminic acid synthase [Methanoregula sp.]
MNALKINKQLVGPGTSTYIIAELSANHNQDFDQAVKLIRSAKDAGADAVKIQTYTPDTMTIDCRENYFQIGDGLIWKGKNLYELYNEAYTPWEWQPELKKIANNIGLDLFSTPFDTTSVDFLEKMDVPAYKVASFEVVDIPLIKKIAGCGKPVIISTGMATLLEIEDAVNAVRETGNNQIALLKCTSAYPASPEEMNLRTIPHMAEYFDVPVGLSDHTLGIAVPLAAVALGACIIEKHFTLSRSTPGPDSAFSLEPQEFKAMVDAVRTTQSALGKVSYEVTEHEKASRLYRRSLFVVRDIARGEILSEHNVRSIRPGHGLPPKYQDQIIGKKAKKDIKRGTPLSWDLVE